jgi:hypothetical protein
VLPDVLTRPTEPEWSRMIPQRSILVIERDDGSIEIHSCGETRRWNDGEGLEMADEYRAAMRRRLLAALARYP